MAVSEISVQVKNIPGQIAQITAVLAESNIGIIGISATGTGKAGWIRLIVDNNKIAEEALKDYGFNSESGVAAAILVNGDSTILDQTLQIMADEKINIDYLYSCAIPNSGNGQAIILGVQMPSKVEKLLTAHNIVLADLDF